MHADENVCEPRERTSAIVAIVIAFLLALFIMLLALWMGLAGGGGGLGSSTGGGAGGEVAGTGIGTGSGSGIGAGQGTGSGDAGSGPGAGESGDGRMAEGTPEAAPPPGEPDGTGTPVGPPAPAIAVPEVEPPKFGFTPPDAPPPPPPVVVQPPTPVVQPPPGVPEGSPSSGASGTSGGGGTGAEFMGVRTAARRVVYVIDRSLSMGPWFGRAMDELERSVSGLKGDTQMSVVFFGGPSPEHYRVLPPGRMVRATESECKRAMTWARAQRPSSPFEMGAADIYSDPATALRQAFDLRPDTLFLLTDGCFDNPERTMALVAASRPRIKSPIHALLIVGQAPANPFEVRDRELAERYMREIAAATGGQFHVAAPETKQ